jgi:hypothetical protein
MAPLRGKPGAGRVGKTRKKHMKRQTEEEERRYEQDSHSRIAW